MTQTWCYRRSSATGISCLLALFLAATPAMANKAAKARVELIPSVTAVVPGQPFELGVKFTIQDHWHIYWSNPGDAGAPPTAKWNLPDGFTVSGFRFPIPERHETVGIVTNIHEGSPVLLVTVTPPATIEGKSVKLTADMRWLVCAENCIQEKQSTSVAIPVASSADASKPNQPALFKSAHKQLPTPEGNAKFVTITPKLGGGKLAPEAKFEIHLDVAIKDGIHIQSDKPTLADQVATAVFMGPFDEGFFEAPQFPAAKSRKLPIGTVNEFTDAITIKVKGEAFDDLAGPSKDFTGLFVYQACDDKGKCFPKEAVEWSLNVPIASAAATNAPDNALADAGADAAPTETETPVVAATDDGNDSEPITGGADFSEADEEPVATASADAPGGFLARFGIVGLFFGCFLYGLFVNATPCVLPVLSIKVMGFVQQAHESRKRTLTLGLSFGAGVILFFVVLGLLASSGQNILQYPVAVIALCGIVLALALSMLDVYTLQVPTVATNLDSQIKQEGPLASFGKGLLAPVLGFACTGPLLAGAFGWATQQDTTIAILAFLFAGLGMSAPYMLLSANPNWLGFLPKPGNWMITFERIMGFALLAMVVWLAHPLASQIGITGLEWTLVFFVAIAFACWILGKINMSMSKGEIFKYRASAAGTIVASALLIFGYISPIDEAVANEKRKRDLEFTCEDDWTDNIPWKKWTECAVNDAVFAGNTVFIDYTAKWCLKCQVNKSVAIDTPEARRRMEELGVIAFKADFTSEDPDIAAQFSNFNRPGPPMNVIYRANNPHEPILLDVELSLDYLLEKLEEAGPSVHKQYSLVSN